MGKAQTVRVGYYQFAPEFGCVSKNLQEVMNFLENIDADIVVLPELPFTGYGFSNREELLSLAEDPDDSPVVSNLLSLCARRSIHVVTGFAERSGDKCYNSSLLLGPSGICGTYRKLHLFDREKLYFDPGDLPLAVFDIGGIRIGMMICFDWIFPEVARTLAMQGADVLCHPANLVLTYCQQTMLSRCIENMVYSVTANRIGCEKHSFCDLKFTGTSQIVAPGGDIIHRGDSEIAEAYSVEINIDRARNKNITQRNDVLADRRPEYYLR
ncbi:acyltransferase [Candidatus Fermentibacteria bacterium]|nr:MAG: acyltransferase [Candidatus Fermentibacteria bacterium]